MKVSVVDKEHMEKLVDCSMCMKFDIPNNAILIDTSNIQYPFPLIEDITKLLVKYCVNDVCKEEQNG